MDLFRTERSQNTHTRLLLLLQKEIRNSVLAPFSTDFFPDRCLECSKPPIVVPILQKGHDVLPKPAQWRGSSTSNHPGGAYGQATISLPMPFAKSAGQRR
jgi:hypothetical protein